MRQVKGRVKKSEGRLEQKKEDESEDEIESQLTRTKQKWRGS
jgi:hypothetical protein